jgi:hypothetical protein
VAPVTSTSPWSFVTPKRSSAIAQSIAVYPAVPIAAVWRSVMPFGTRTSQSPFTRIFWPRPPQWFSPRPQPLRITSSPAFQSGWPLDSTTPEPSMPATMGQLRTMGERLVSASASLKLIVGGSDSGRDDVAFGQLRLVEIRDAAWKASPSFVR